MPRYLDSMRYIRVRKGVSFHWFGEGCIADYYGSSIAYLDKYDVELIRQCDGKNPLYKVQHHIVNGGFHSMEDFQQRVERLIKKGVIVLRDQQTDADIVFTGQFGSYYPKELTIELTSVCNFNCPFCYRNASYMGESITDAQMERVCELFKDKVRNVLFTGGEPTIHPNYQKYIRMFSQYAEVHMISNGSMLYKHDFAALKMLSSIQFSIYGCDDEQYFKMTGVSDGFSRLKRSVEAAKENGICTRLAFTMCDETLPYLESFIHRALEFEVDMLRVGMADSFGRGASLYAESSDFIKKRDMALDKILRMKRKYGKQIKIEIPNIATDHVNDHNDLYENVYKGYLSCGCGTEHIVISPSGGIRPCQMLPEIPFSLFKARVIEEHVAGDMHKIQLHESIYEYCKLIGCDTPMKAPCHALETFLREEEK